MRGTRETGQGEKESQDPVTDRALTRTAQGGSRASVCGWRREAHSLYKHKTAPCG